MGMPGKALKLEVAQKKVSSQSETNIQLGSGWKPGNIGLKKVVFSARLTDAAAAVAAKVRSQSIFDNLEANSKPIILQLHKRAFSILFKY